MSSVTHAGKQGELLPELVEGDRAARSARPKLRYRTSVARDHDGLAAFHGVHHRGALGALLSVV